MDLDLAPTPEASNATGTPATRDSPTESNVETSNASMKSDLLRMTVEFKKFKTALYREVEDYPSGSWPNMTTRSKNSCRNALAKVDSMLTMNINLLRLRPTALELLAIGARLAAVKEGFVFVEARMTEVQYSVASIWQLMLRMEWREAKHAMLSKIYAESSLATAYEALDISEATAGWVALPKTYYFENRELQWPEQLGEIGTGTICAICRLNLSEDPEHDATGTFAIIPVSCCQQSFHSACLSIYIRQKNIEVKTCPLCRAIWNKQKVADVAATRITQMEEMEEAWKKKIRTGQT
jgi:hypothetical protein